MKMYGDFFFLFKNLHEQIIFYTFVSLKVFAARRYALIQSLKSLFEAKLDVFEFMLLELIHCAYFYCIDTTESFSFVVSLNLWKSKKKNHKGQGR